MAWSKVRWRMEQAIRYQIKNPGATDAEVASFLGMTASGITAMKRRPEYQRLWQQFTSGISSIQDEELIGDLRALRQRHAAQVPMALQKLYELAENPDPKVALRAVENILDREGNFATVSRIGAPSEEQGGANMQKADKDIASQILGVMGK